MGEAPDIARRGCCEAVVCVGACGEGEEEEEEEEEVGKAALRCGWTYSIVLLADADTEPVFAAAAFCDVLAADAAAAAERMGE